MSCWFAVVFLRPVLRWWRGGALFVSLVLRGCRGGSWSVFGWLSRLLVVSFSPGGSGRRSCACSVPPWRLIAACGSPAVCVLPGAPFGGGRGAGLRSGVEASGGWVGIFFAKVVNTMYAFYRIQLMTEYGDRSTTEYRLNQREEMLEYVRLLMKEEDTAYVDVLLISNEGELLKHKMLEGAAYERFVDAL